MIERRQRRRRVQAAHGPNHERWLVSYADFITLLFAFFTTMYAISTVDARKLSSMVESMQQAFDSKGIPAPAPVNAAPATQRPPVIDAAQRERLLAAALRERLGGTSVDVEIDHRGIVVSLREAGSFATGSADLSNEARSVLKELAGTLGTGSAMTLRVEGHTDDVPIRTGRFASNWELSTARATSVVTYLVQDLGIEPRRLSAAGYGQYHPRLPNLNDGDRARNRRVDIVILNEETTAAEEPGQMVPAAPGGPPGRTGLPSGRVFAG